MSSVEGWKTIYAERSFGVPDKPEACPALSYHGPPETS
jgi:hypothetical protein